LAAALVVLTLLAAACTGDRPPAATPTSGTTASSSAQPGPNDLSGVCPNPVVIQTDWNPESEYGATYNLLGSGYRIDTRKASVRGPLVDNGRRTGIDVEIRAGGPAINFESVSKTMYTDRAITLGFVNNEQAVALSSQFPTTAVVAPLEISPGMLMWDPVSHPDWNTIVDIGQTSTKVLVTGDDIFPEYLVGTGILRRSQIDASYDGSPGRFIGSKGAVAQGGFATAEPWLYENAIPEWRGKKVEFALIHDTGFVSYTQTLAIRSGAKAELAPCLRKLVPVIQRSIAGFIAAPAATNNKIVALAKAYDNGWDYPEGLADFSVAQQRRLGIVGNGPDQTIGNFDPARVQRTLDIVRPILAGQRKAYKTDLTADELATNDFIDPAVGLK
jgi:hypothetical protein